MPQICQLIQNWGRRWARRVENRNFPVLPWEKFESEFEAVTREKVRAATEYLHEAGHVILFKSATPPLPPSLSLENEDEPCGFEGGRVILKPEWFCKQVVGNLLLPADIASRLSDVLDFESEKDGAVRIATLAKDEFKVPRDKIDEVVKIMCRLGICYQLQGRPDIIFVPALMEDSDVPGWSCLWKHGSVPGAWVTRFSLKVKNPKATLLPINVLAQLQVSVALDKDIGQKPECDFIARKNSVSFKFRRMHVLIDYSAQKQERIDVLVKPFVREFSRKEQINVAQEFVSRIYMIAKECARGVELEKHIVRPWSVAAGWTGMAERIVDMRVESVVKEVEERGYLAMLQLDVDGVLVREDDVLSDDDLSGFWRMQGLSAPQTHVLEGAACPSREYPGDEGGTSSIPMANKPDLQTEILHRLDKVNNNVCAGRAESSCHFNGFGVEIAAGFREVNLGVKEVGNRVGESQEDMQEVGQTVITAISELNQDVQCSETRIKEVVEEWTRLSKRALTRGVRDSERRIKARVQEGEGRIRAEVVELSQSLSLLVQNLGSYLLEDREARVPRRMYVRAPGESSRRWYTDLTRPVAETLTLGFLCEASFEDGNVHEVATQEGIDVRDLKDWAKKWWPKLAWILKLLRGVGKMGQFAIPALDLLVGPGAEVSRKVGNVADVTQGAAELGELLGESTSDAFTSFVSEQESLRHNSAASSSGQTPDTVKQLEGDAVKDMNSVLEKVEVEGSWNKKVGLKRVQLEKRNHGGRKHVVWICSRCYDSYKRDRPDSIRDAPVS